MAAAYAARGATGGKESEEVSMELVRRCLTLWCMQRSNIGTRLDMIGILVNDLPRMVKFYRDVLGFETDWNGQGPYAGFRHEGVRFSM